MGVFSSLLNYQMHSGRGREYNISPLESMDPLYIITEYGIVLALNFDYNLEKTESGVIRRILT